MKQETYKHLIPFILPSVIGILFIAFCVWGFVFFSIRWWLTLEIIMIFTFIFSFKIFAFLPDRGWCVSRFMGLLLIVYVSWLCSSMHLPPFVHNIHSWTYSKRLSASLHIIPFSQLLLLFVLIIFGGVSAYIFATQKRLRGELLTFFKENKRYILIAETIFFFGFMLFVNIRSYCPDITYDIGRHAAEKFDNFEVLNSIYRTKYFPPEDAWLSGYPINYYYWGHLLWASLGKLSGYSSPYAFNLGLATIFALSLLMGFSLGYNISRRIGIGLLAGFGVAVFGNIHSVLNFLDGVSAGVKLDYIFNASFLWQPSRVIKGTITEFPAFTALLGDLHAHHSGLLTILLGLTATLNLLLGVKRTEASLSRKQWCWRNLLPWAILLGWISGVAYAINAWDTITLSLLFFLCLLYITRERNSDSFWRWILYAGSAVLVMVILNRLFIRPFSDQFRPPLPMEIHPHILPWKWEIKKFPLALLQSVNRTQFVCYFVHFGFFLIPIYIWLLSRIKQHIKGKKELSFSLIGLFLVFIIISTNYFHRMLPGFLFFVLVVVIYLFFKELDSNSELRWILLLLGMASFISIFVEFVYFDDRYAGELERYNTLFKFYNHIWPMYAVVASWCWWQLLQQAKKKRLTVFVAVSLGIVIVLSMIYPIGGTIERTERFLHRRGPPERRPARTLDGIAYLSSGMFSNDYQVIVWARKNIQGRPVVLEATGSPYSPYSRFATNTGIPTVLGWGHHVAQWRGEVVYSDKLGELMNIGRREQAIKLIYNTQDLERVVPLLKKYNVRYVFVGALERKDFPASSLKKFEKFKKIYSFNDSVLYEVSY